MSPRLLIVVLVLVGCDRKEVEVKCMSEAVSRYAVDRTPMHTLCSVRYFNVNEHYIRATCLCPPIPAADADTPRKP